jgi:fibronectin-binding autotransporter adhesin
MACAFRDRVFALSLAIIGLGIFSLGMQPAQAGNFSWSGSAGATWGTASNNWVAQSGTTNVAQPWNSTTGPSEQANFITPGASANATGNNLYAFIVDFQANSTGDTITGGTLNVSQTAFGIYNQASSGTNTITSAIVLAGTNNIQNTQNSGVSTGTVFLNLTGVVTNSSTMIVNPGGNTSAGTGSTIAFAGTNDTFNIFQESGNHGTILIPSGGSVSTNMFDVINYGVDLVNGNLTSQNWYGNYTSISPPHIIAGSGAISLGNFLANHGGLTTVGSANSNYPFTGSLTVSGSFAVGLNAFPGYSLGSNGYGGTVNQTGGTVQLNGTGDSVLLGFAGSSTYNMYGGFLSISNAPLELGFGNASGFSSVYSQTGGLANIYGLSMGTTQNFGTQPGNCTVNVTGGTLNLGAGGIASGGVATYSVTLGNATVGATAPWSTSFPSPITMTLNNSTTATFNTAGGNITIANPIGGGGGLTASGGGTLLLDAANTYTGGTHVTGGTLQLGDGVANVGSLTSNISASGGAVVLFAVPSSNTVTYSNAMSGAGSLAITGPGTLIINGTNNSFSGGTTISAGTLQLGDGMSNNGNLSSAVTNNAVLAFNNPQPQTFAASIGGSGPVFVNGPGSLALAGNNTFSGGVTLAPNTTLYVNSNTALGSGTLTISGGVIDSTTAGVALGNVPQVWNSDFTFGGTNNLNLGTGAVLLGSSRTVTLNAGVLTVNGPISDGGAGYSLSTAGTGTLALGGTSTFSGGAFVNSGALAVNGALTGIGGVTVQSGGTLAGSGLVSGGGATLNSGAVLSPGPSPLPGSIGTFTASTLSVGNGATIDFDLSHSTAGGNDKVVVTGNLSLPNGGNDTIDVNPTAGSLALNTPYTLFNYGSLSYTGSPLVYAGPLGGRQTASINYGTGSNSSITLTIAGNFANLVWTGTGSNTDVWDQNDTSNLSWSSSQYPAGAYFAALDFVRFDATSTPGNQTVTLDFNGGSPLTPSSVLVTGSKSYTFNGPGQIGGATALTVAGPGSLTIQNAGNSYTGGTNIQGGSVILGVNNGLSPNGTVTFGAAATGGTLDLAGNSQTVSGLAVAPGAAPAQQIITDSTGSSTLTYGGSGSTTFGGTITDTAATAGGTLALNVSSGQLVLSGANKYAGGTTVSGGTLQLGASNALPTSGGITAYAGGTLDLGGNSQTTSGTVSLQGGTVQNGMLTSTAAAFDGQSGTVAANLAGPVALNKSSGGVLVIGGPGSSYTGGTNVLQGTLQLGSANALPTGGNITVYSGGTFDLGGVSQSTSGVLSIQGGAIQDGTLNGTGAAFDGESGTVTANLTGSAGLHMSTSAGMLVLGGTNTYAGNTVVNGGTLQLGSPAGIPGGPMAGTLVLNGGAAAAGIVDVNGFAADFGGLSGAAGAVPGTITNNAFGANATLTVGDNNGTSTFSGTLADGNSTLGLTKAGTGTLTLAGSNAYSGDTTVSQGILVATNTAALGNPTSSTNLFVNTGGELQLPAGVATSAGNVYVAGSGVTGSGAINGGTLNVTGGSVTMNGSSGTAVIGSPTILSAAATTLTCTNGNQTLLFSGPLTSSGSLTTSGSGSFVFGGVTNISGLQEGNSIASRTAVISVLPGATLNSGTYFTQYYSNLTVGGTMNANTFATANSNAGNMNVNGNGVINAVNFFGSGDGTVEFGTLGGTNGVFNGTFNVTGSAAIGGAGPFNQLVGNTLQQDSGTVNFTGTGDGFTIGFSDGSHANGAYTFYGGVLNVPNEYVELCYESGAGGNSYFQVLGASGRPATANVYGISLGQTVNNGVQNGNGTVKLGAAGSRLVIGAGGIVAAGTGTQQFLLSTGTLASSAPWSTDVPLGFNGAGATNIDASSGSIGLNATLSGSGGLCEIGSGLLVLGGTNTYTGGTTVVGGELIAANNEAIEDGTNVYVGSDLAAFGTVVPAEVGNASAAPAPSPVPEPGALVLLAAGTALALLRCGRRRTSRI